MWRLRSRNLICEPRIPCLWCIRVKWLPGLWWFYYNIEYCQFLVKPPHPAISQHWIRTVRSLTHIKAPLHQKKAPKFSSSSSRLARYYNLQYKTSPICSRVFKSSALHKASMVNQPNKDVETITVSNYCRPLSHHFLVTYSVKAEM